MLPQPTNKTSSSVIHFPSWALQSQVAPSFLTEEWSYEWVVLFMLELSCQAFLHSQI